MAACQILNMPIHCGYLFRPLSPSGDIRQARLTSSAAQTRFAAYVRHLPAQFRQRRVTLHGLRSGCAISLAFIGAEIFLENPCRCTTLY